eukprot:scaffold19219_cov34-Tisochrysis_lutea.AAC.2
MNKERAHVIQTYEERPARTVFHAFEVAHVSAWCASLGYPDAPTRCDNRTSWTHLENRRGKGVEAVMVLRIPWRPSALRSDRHRNLRWRRNRRYCGAVQARWSPARADSSAGSRPQE